MRVAQLLKTEVMQNEEGSMNASMVKANTSSLVSPAKLLLQANIRIPVPAHVI